MPLAPAIGTFLVLALSAGASEAAVWEWYGYIFGKAFCSEIDAKLIDSPNWDKGADNPPLPARKALELADKLATEVVREPPGWGRKLVCLSLVPLENRWTWQANYLWHGPKGGTNRSGEVPFFVLMHGRIVTPKITDTNEEEKETPALKDNGLRWESHPPNGRNYVCRVSKEALARSPAWLESRPNPPLSAREALNRAEDFAKRTLGDNTGWKRELHGLMLTPAGEKDKWLWVACYEWFPERGGLSGCAPSAYSIVLMDGTVVTPEAIDDPDSRCSSKPEK